MEDLFWMRALEAVYGKLSLLELGPWVSLVSGAAFLCFGRHLFWMCCALWGFVLGMQAADLFSVSTGSTPFWIAAAAGGVFGAVIALVIQRAAVVIVGAAVGAGLVGQLGPLVPWSEGWPVWSFFAVGAAMGAVAGFFLIRWVLIGVTSLIGAMLLVSTFAFSDVVSWAAVLLLTVLGILLQSGGPRAEKRGKK